MLLLCRLMDLIVLLPKLLVGPQLDYTVGYVRGVGQAWLPGYLATLATWLPGYLATWLPGYLAKP